MMETIGGGESVGGDSVSGVAGNNGIGEGGLLKKRCWR